MEVRECEGEWGNVVQEFPEWWERTKPQVAALDLAEQLRVQGFDGNTEVGFQLIFSDGAKTEVGKFKIWDVKNMTPEFFSRVASSKSQTGSVKELGG